MREFFGIANERGCAAMSAAYVAKTVDHLVGRTGAGYTVGKRLSVEHRPFRCRRTATAPIWHYDGVLDASHQPVGYGATKRDALEQAYAESAKWAKRKIAEHQREVREQAILSLCRVARLLATGSQYGSRS